ncbi:RrF2 family transcriptional regulator [Maribacter algicola]|uniref:RrF2 family transcriptional regulator n=1 Tax=Meishania litoralis TaxID=3434685 RepID=A0ACC7LFX9_9FLAO
MLSNSSKYALKAVLYLAVNSTENHKILVKTLSSRINVPKAYLSKILQELSKHNLVSSTKGPKGGFYLAEENREVRLVQIVNTIDGDNRLTSCLLSLNQCNADYPCPLHDLAGKAKSNFLKNLEETTVQDLVFDIASGKSFLPL